MVRRRPTARLTKEFGKDPTLEPWYRLAVEWSGEHDVKRRSVFIFLIGYIQGMNLERDPSKFLLKSYMAPSFENYLKHNASIKFRDECCTRIHDFLDWVLFKKFSETNQLGQKIVFEPYHNPVPRMKRKYRMTIDDPKFNYFLQIDATLDRWGWLATDWYHRFNPRISTFRTLVNLFLLQYIRGMNLERDPSKFLLKSYSAPPFERVLDSTLDNRYRIDYCTKIHDFLEWVLKDKFSAPDEQGHQVIFPQYHNPVPRLKRKILNKINDPELSYLIQIDPSLDQWRKLAVEYSNEDRPIWNNLRSAFDFFFLYYIQTLNLERDPSKFLLKSYSVPSFSDHLKTRRLCKKSQMVYCSRIHDFLNWVLREKFARPNERGIRIICDKFHNPVQDARITRGANLGKGTDFAFQYVLQIDPSLEEWRILAAEWFKSESRARQVKQKALDKFLLEYIHDRNLERNPKHFLRRSYPAPPWGECFEANSKSGVAQGNVIHKFLAWTLETKLSITNNGQKYVPPEYHNPLFRMISGHAASLSESDKVPLPYRLIRELRQLLCQGPHLKEWKLAQNIIDSRFGGGDWFEVDSGVIDQSDPDCVWRKRAFSKHEKRKKGYDGETYELWSPVRAVGLYVKLHLPLRTFQLRMLDSGEADTWRYENKRWRLNDSPLRIGDEKRPHHRGVFHRSVDSKTRQPMTGFYINTNKTADINKDEMEKGYTIPWQNEEVLYWLEKLRNWQQKYNPIKSPVAWKNLEQKHFGFAPPLDSILEQKGSVCFLFRHAAATDFNGRSKPLPAGSFNRLWWLVLNELERRCDERGESLDDGSKIRFVEPAPSNGTHYPLHSLRVSLITAYALEGGVPFPILSKLVVGHARLVMTLYYTKAGKAHVTQLMEEAEKKLLENEQGSYRRFIMNATYKELEESFAFNDAPSIFSACQHKSAGSLVVEDKGICTVGCGRCDVGGDPVTNNSNPKNTVYAPVAGYPMEKNCVRCRFFLTGPAFLPGLIAHFNSISYQLSDASSRYVRIEKEVNELEDLLLECEEKGRLFTQSEELNRFNRFYEEEAEKVNKFANDLHATLRLIDRCKVLLQEAPGDGVSLVPIGGVTDIQYALEETDSEMLQLEVICENAVLFPETNASKATLRRSQILDAMMELNGHTPLFFKLTEEQQLLVGNELMKLIRVRTGNLKDAVDFAEGKRVLAEIGLLDDATSLLEEKIKGVPFINLISLRPERPMLDQKEEKTIL